MTNSSLPFIQSQKANKIGYVFSVLPKIKPIWRERINLDENVYTFIDFCDKNECWRRNIAPDDRLLLSSIFTKHLNTCQRNSSFIIKSSKSETKSIFFCFSPITSAWIPPTIQLLDEMSNIIYTSFYLMPKGSERDGTFSVDVLTVDMLTFELSNRNILRIRKTYMH